MTEDNGRAIAAWSAYWRSGRGASCFDGADVEVRLTECWDELVDSISDGARLLDLAAGNGAVAKVCVARARARGIALHVDAVDAAAIDPAGCVPDPAGLLRDVRFQGGIRIESLPFSDATFDAVVSQFGFEYAEPAPAAAEAARVLAPSGRLRFILHARDGAVTHDIGRRLERLHGILAGGGPAALVLALARANAAGDAEAVLRLSMRLGEAIASTRGLAAHPPRDDAALFYASEFLQAWSQRGRYRPADLLRSIEEGWANAAGVAARQADMLRAARSAEDVAAIAEHLRTAGLDAGEPEAIRDAARGAQIAWRLDARKPSGASGYRSSG